MVDMPASDDTILVPMRQLALVDAPVYDPSIDDAYDQLPEDFPIPLRPYQMDGVRFLRTARRGMCTYQPGLGKTETAIAACLDPEHPTFVERRTLTHRGPLSKTYTITKHREYHPSRDGKRAKVVIVAPSYLTDMWFDRILKYLPYARVVLAQGTRRAREKALALDADWYIINYEMLHAREFTKAQLAARERGQRKHRDMDPFDIPEADFYIFDESHNLKNHQGKQAQAAAELVRPNHARQWSPNVYLLSGTPIKREPDDLYMQMHILYPFTETHGTKPSMFFRSYQDFVRNYCVYLPNPWSGNKVVGARGQAQAKRDPRYKTPIERLMDDTAIYTSYEEAEVYRPDIEPTPVHITLDDDYRKAYDEIAEMYAYQDMRLYSAMEVIHALRAVTACPSKVKAAINLADQFPDGCMFFTYYVANGKLLSRALSEALNTEVPFIAGSQETRREDRERILASNPKYLVGTLKSLSVGINSLTYMKAVVFLDEDWTPDVIEQAIDRVRRFGNDTSKVFVYYLLGRNTIDDHIHAVVGRRGITAEMIVRRVLNKYRRSNQRIGDD